MSLSIHQAEKLKKCQTEAQTVSHRFTGADQITVLLAWLKPQVCARTQTHRQAQTHTQGEPKVSTCLVPVAEILVQPLKYAIKQKIIWLPSLPTNLNQYISMEECS